MRIRREDVEAVRDRAADRRRRRRARHAEVGRGRLDEGPVPVPRRADPVLPRPPAGRPLALLRLRRGRRRHLLRAEDRPPGLHRGGGAAGRPDRLHAAVRGRRRSAAPEAGRTGRTAPAAGRGAPGGGGVLRRAARRHPRRRGRAAVPDRAGLRPGGLGGVRRRLRAAPGRGAAAAPARPRLHRGRAGRLRPGRPRPARHVRPVPRPAAVADPGPHRGRGRLRRPPAVRRRLHRGEVPEHPGDGDLQEVPGALRGRPGQAGDRPDTGRSSWSRATPT